MITLCWFYCIPFAKFLYFAAAPFVFMLALFVLKRGIQRHRRDLRKMSFFMMFASVLKFFIFDLHMLKDDLFCAEKTAGPFICTTTGLRLVELTGILLAVAASLVLFHFYRVFMPERKVEERTPDQARLGFWSRGAFIAASLLAVWQLAPWVGYLTVGHVPAIFTVVPWQYFAVLGFGLILTGFWKAESCVVGYRFSRRGNKRRIRGVWSPRDLLWMAAFIYALTLAMSYVSHDVLSRH